jgi:hypothetical protein
MSGFEVCGIVFGVYPLLLDGLRLYQAVASGTEIASLITDVEHEQIRYNDFLGRLFGVENLGNDEGVFLSSLTHDQKTDLGRRLSEKKAKSICETVEEMNSILKSMERDVDGARAGNGLVSCHTRENHSAQTERE